MMRKWSVTLGVIACLWSLQTRAQDPGSKPSVWMGPPSYDNGKCFRELFEKPEAWQETRSVVDVLTYADHRLQHTRRKAACDYRIPGQENTVHSACVSLSSANRSVTCCPTRTGKLTAVWRN